LPIAGQISMGTSIANCRTDIHGNQYCQLPDRYSRDISWNITSWSQNSSIFVIYTNISRATPNDVLRHPVWGMLSRRKYTVVTVTGSARCNSRVSAQVLIWNGLFLPVLWTLFPGLLIKSTNRCQWYHLSNKHFLQAQNCRVRIGEKLRGFGCETEGLWFETAH